MLFPSAILSVAIYLILDSTACAAVTTLPSGFEWLHMQLVQAPSSLFTHSRTALSCLSDTLSSASHLLSLVCRKVAYIRSQLFFLQTIVSAAPAPGPATYAVHRQHTGIASRTLRLQKPIDNMSRYHIRWPAVPSANCRLGAQPEDPQCGQTLRRQASCRRSPR